MYYVARIGDLNRFWPFVEYFQLFWVVESVSGQKDLAFQVISRKVARIQELQKEYDIKQKRWIKMVANYSGINV